MVIIKPSGAAYSYTPKLNQTTYDLGGYIRYNNSSRKTSRPVVGPVVIEMCLL